jgi:hypothetical protein
MINLKSFIETPLVSGSKNMVETVEGFMRSLFYQGNEVAVEIPFPEDTFVEQDEQLIVNFEKLVDWCANFYWLDVPEDRSMRATWLVDFQYGEEVLVGMQNIRFGEDGNILFEESDAYAP